MTGSPGAGPTPASTRRSCVGPSIARRNAARVRASRGHTPRCQCWQQRARGALRSGRAWPAAPMRPRWPWPEWRQQRVSGRLHRVRARASSPSPAVLTRATSLTCSEGTSSALRFSLWLNMAWSFSLSLPLTIVSRLPSLFESIASASTLPSPVVSTGTAATSSWLGSNG